MEKELIIRLIQKEDIPYIVKMAQKGFDNPDIAFEEQHYESHINIFPEGQICIEYDGKIIGSCSSLIVNYDEYGDGHSFSEISGNNFITNHNPNGKHLYGIDVVVDLNYRHLKIGRRLYEERRKLCKRYNLKSIIFGGRIPNYHTYANEMTAEQYVQHVEQQKIYDPVLRFQLMNGFKIRGIKEKYLQHDWASLEYATLLEWENIDYVPEEKQYYQHAEPIRIASIQYQLRQVDDFGQFSSICEYFIQSSSKKRVDFIVFPATLTEQLLSFTSEKVPRKQIDFLTTFTNKYEDLFTDLAIRYNVNIVAGSHFINRNDDIFELSYLFHRNGKIDKQEKIHTTAHERNWLGLGEGTEMKVFDTDCGKVAIIIGYDNLHPQLAQIVTDKGANIIFSPFKAENRKDYLRIRHCTQARAIENEVFYVLSGKVGHLPHVSHLPTNYAQSAIFSPIDVSFPDDGVIAQCEANSETIVYGDVDLELLRRNRLIGSVTPLKDRKFI